MLKKKTKIVATIGPASENITKLTKMVREGLDVARLNFSHGDHAEHKERIKTVRLAAKRSNKYVAILLDLGGPKIRTGDFEDGSVTLKKGQKFTFTTRKCIGTKEHVYITYKKLPQEVCDGGVILLDDGTKKFVITSVRDTEIMTRVVNGGLVRSRRGVNVPGADLSIQSLTTKDRRDVAFGVTQSVDFFALSFVRSAKDIYQLRRILQKNNSRAQIIAKIETQEAIEDIDAIIEATDGIMIARGDLAVEVSAEHVPHLQKSIIAKCNIAAKPVIVATQMLESMITAPVPTRAEVNDVTNAILDGTDAIMLSAETAVGDFALETISVMRTIALRTERERYFHERISTVHAQNKDRAIVNAVTLSVVHTADDVGAAAITVLTESGFTARHVSRYKPQQPIIVMSPDDLVCRQLMLSFGCYPRKVTRIKRLKEALRETRKIAFRGHFAMSGDIVVFTAGTPFGKAGTTNTMIAERM